MQLEVRFRVIALSKLGSVAGHMISVVPPLQLEIQIPTSESVGNPATIAILITESKIRI